jgi:CubicO group peptidase (beta-lactamase class C family)
MRKTTALCLIVACVAGAWSAPLGATSAELASNKKTEIRALVRRVLSKSPIPSASVAVVVDGELAYAEAFGLANLDPARPATTQTRYDIGSVSKQFTAAAVLLLAEDGKLSLDDKVGRFFPNLTGADKVTVRQLLSHTAGYPNYWEWFFLTDEMRRPIAPQAIVDRWGARPLEFEPGSQWDYSNTNYTIAGRIAETVSGRPLRALLAERVFAPLGMTDVGDADGVALTPTDATRYGRNLLGPARPAQAPGRGWAFGAGGLSMSAADLARWDIGLIRRAPLPPSLYDQMTREMVLKDGKGAGYGLGVYVDQIDGHQRIHHDGVAPGAMTENRIYPNDHMAIVVMINGEFGHANYAIADGLEALLLGTAAPAEQPEGSAPKPPSTLVRKLVAQVRAGRLDRSKFTPEASAFFTSQTLADYRDSLARLGPPKRFVTVFEDRFADTNVSVFELTWPDRRLLGKVKVRDNGAITEFSMIAPD